MDGEVVEGAELGGGADAFSERGGVGRDDGTGPQVEQPCGGGVSVGAEGEPHGVDGHGAGFAGGEDRGPGGCVAWFVELVSGDVDVCGVPAVEAAGDQVEFVVGGSDFGRVLGGHSSHLPSSRVQPPRSRCSR